MDADHDHREILSLATEIVAAFVGNNSVAAVDLPEIISSVFSSLAATGKPAVEAPIEPTPAVPVKKSVFPDYIVCLEDGKKLKMLKRHLATRYAMTTAQYRQKWGLPADYPMVAPNYAAQRSELARKIGLGRKRTAEPTPAPARRSAGRKRTG